MLTGRNSRLVTQAGAMTHIAASRGGISFRPALAPMDPQRYRTPSPPGFNVGVALGIPTGFGAHARIRLE